MCFNFIRYLYIIIGVLYWILNIHSERKRLYDRPISISSNVLHEETIPEENSDDINNENKSLSDADLDNLSTQTEGILSVSNFSAFSMLECANEMSFEKFLF